ncbi:RNA pseudouridine synthase [Cyanobium sp. ATX 6A2]|nr:RNA pseudouridine synthase [Cyanobium sp. ATX 6A2]
MGPEATGLAVSAFYAGCYRHSDQDVWRQRLAAGEICRNGQQLRADVVLAAGDRLSWHRPPWHEPAVPVLPGPLVDDGDLVVFNKPSGLPVLPAGGFLEHTLLRQIEHQLAAAELDGAAGLPRPVHRLGRFTSGLLLCARRPASRAWLSALLRESTAAPARADAAPCRKTYRALLQPPAPGSPLLALLPGTSLDLTTPIGRRSHALLGQVWAAAESQDPSALPARSRLRLLRRGGEGCGRDDQAAEAWLVEVAIATGRPHQIRIHAAAAGAPLLGDPLYRRGGMASAEALPGDGGYRLHAHRLRLPTPEGGVLELEAPLPSDLLGPNDG